MSQAEGRSRYCETQLWFFELLSESEPQQCDNGRENIIIKSHKQKCHPRIYLIPLI